MMRKLGLALVSIFLGLAPAQAQQSVSVPATTASIPIAGTVAGSTKIITGVAGKSIYITSIALVPVDTAVVTLTYGTGTNCGTGTGSLTGAMTFAAGQVLNFGTGFGAVLVVPSGNDVCITIATAAAPGSLSYSLF